MNKYTGGSGREDFKTGTRLFDWSQNHKTLIVLNGGANTDIEDTYSLLANLAPRLNFPMPYDCFREDEKSLGNIMTACGCVLPEEIYNAVDYRKASTIIKDVSKMPTDRDAYYYLDLAADGADYAKLTYQVGSAEHELITMLKSCSLAR
ncbi:MAG TPA: hypothetical protein VFM18_17910 [Methanosarcina sp.]|nr:hypothetical protein [Methanosarcina sp.]